MQLTELSYRTLTAAITPTLLSGPQSFEEGFGGTVVDSHNIGSIRG